jgi:hypothetical protein
MIIEFTGGSRRYVEKTMELVISLLAASFGDIRPIESATPAHLARKAVHFFPREVCCNSLSVQGQKMYFLPNLKSPEVFH